MLFRSIGGETVLAKKVIVVVVVHCEQPASRKCTDGSTHFHGISLIASAAREFRFHRTSVHRQGLGAEAGKHCTAQSVGNGEAPSALSLQVAVLHENQTVGLVVDIAHGITSGQLPPHAAVAAVVLIAIGQCILSCEIPSSRRREGRTKRRLSRLS